MTTEQQDSQRDDGALLYASVQPSDEREHEYVCSLLTGFIDEDAYPTARYVPQLIANSPADNANVLAPCPRGWRIPTDMTIEISRLAIDTGFWPLFEVENGEWSMTPVKGERKPLEDFLRPQGRFKHLFADGNEGLLEELQQECDDHYAYVERMCAR